MEIDRSDTLDEVNRALDAYLLALEDNDLVRLDQVFWDSAKTVRFGGGETLIGKDQIQAFRKSRGARTPLTISQRIVTSFGTDTACVNLVFTREGAHDKIGRWSQHWAKIDDTWYITAAHVSTVSS